MHRPREGEGLLAAWDLTRPRIRARLPSLILYDIDDETERNPAERPFRFMPTLDPAHYLAEHRLAGAGRLPRGQQVRAR